MNRFLYDIGILHERVKNSLDSFYKLSPKENENKKTKIKQNYLLSEAVVWRYSLK